MDGSGSGSDRVDGGKEEEGEEEEEEEEVKRVATFSIALVEGVLLRLLERLGS